jgi:hypothetical protein
VAAPAVMFPRPTCRLLAPTASGGQYLVNIIENKIEPRERVTPSSTPWELEFMIETIRSQDMSYPIKAEHMVEYPINVV